MAKNYALIENNIVLNTILWEGENSSPIEFENGVICVPFPDVNGINPSIGWLYKGGTFSAPPLTEEQISEQNKIKTNNNIAMKGLLISKATSIIQPLQDAVDLDMATDDDKEKLIEYKKYRVLLMRVEANTPEDINFPVAPV